MKNVILILLVGLGLTAAGCNAPSGASPSKGSSSGSSSGSGGSGSGSGGGGGSNPQPPNMTGVDPNGAEASLLQFNVNASDPQSETLSYSCVLNCPAGLSINASSGLVSWTPNYGQAGTYNVTFQATNTSGLSTNAAFQIVIAHTPRAPNLNSISAQSVNTGANLSFTPVCSSPDGDAVSISMSNLPAGSSYSAGVFNFSPSYSQAGQYTVGILCNDAVESLSASESVTITVNYQGTAPVMSSVSNQSVAQQQAISFSVSASDADGATLSYSASGLPAGATFSGQNFNWTPSCGQSGSFTPTFTVTDPTDGYTDSKTPTITVNSADYYSVTWNASFPPSLSGTSGNSTNAYIGQGYYLGGGSLTYAYVAEYDCNNHAWTKSFNASTKTLAITNPLGATDPGTHSFLVYTMDACGTINYRFVQVTGYSGSFSVQKSDQGSTYSTAGLCGGGTVYAH